MPKILEFYCSQYDSMQWSCQQFDFCICLTDLTCMIKQNQYQASMHWREKSVLRLLFSPLFADSRGRKGFGSMLSTCFRTSILSWAGDPSRSLNVHLHISLDSPNGFLTSLPSDTCKQKPLAIVTPLRSSHLFFPLHDVSVSNSQSSANLLFNSCIGVHTGIEGGTVTRKVLLKYLAADAVFGKCSWQTLTRLFYEDI